MPGKSTTPPKTLPDTVRLTLYVLRPMRNERWVRKFLDVFESFPTFAPTHWSSKDQRSLPPYIFKEAMRGIVEDEFDQALGVFKRAKAPKYEGFLFANNEELSTIEMKFGPLCQRADVRSAVFLRFGTRATD